MKVINYKIYLIIIAVIINTAFGSYWYTENDTYSRLGLKFKREYVLDFNFGNHIDTHQKSRLNKRGNLSGFLFITFTGETNEDGIPIATHCNEDTPKEECVAGWRIRGKFGKARFVYHYNDHPIWLVNSRNDIPQPGGYSHFHWLGLPDMAKELEENEEYNGYFLELRAVRKFVFKHHGTETMVRPGVDLATHLNIITSFPGYEHGEGGHDH